MSSFPASVPICVDGRMLVSGATGVSGYAAALVAATRRIGGRPMLLEDRDEGRLRRWRAALGAADRFVTSVDGGSRLVGDHLFRAAQVRFGLCRQFMTVRSDTPPGIMHWTYPVPLRMAGWINLYTVHDVVPLERPDLSPVDPRRLRAILSRIAVTGDRIVTVSEASRDRIVTLLEVDPRRVVNCYQAVGGDAEPEGHDGPLPAGLTAGRYFLFCGLTEARKNIVRLIAAHALSGSVYPLVITGPPTADRRIARAIDAAVAAGRVRRLDYLPGAQLAALQAQACALLFPSLGEGFGLPVVEAMRAGTPVLTSYRGALAEIAGDAAWLVDPEDVAAIAAGIARLAGDGDLRRRLSDRGRRRAGRFTAARFAARLRAVYSDALVARGLSGE